MRSPYHIILLLVTHIWVAKVVSQQYILEENINYYSQNINDSYQKERCKLDVYFPKGIKDFPTVVCFHGGGLKGGEKVVPDLLKDKGIAVVAVNYRLHPKVSKNTTDESELYLPIQNLLKIFPSNSSLVISPEISPRK